MNQQIETLTDVQLAGQRLMVGFDGKTVDKQLAAMITRLRVGGVALFKRNVATPDQLSALCRDIQSLSRQTGNPPLLIAVDQEVGPVARLGPPFTVFPGNRAIGESQSPDAAEEFGLITAIELKDVGINMNFAPVLDTVPFEDDGFVMTDRVFGHSPRLTTDLGIRVIETMQSNGVAATAKHFPGIGRTTIDSHADLPSLDTDQETLRTADLLPFHAAIQHDVAAMMLSHVIYTDIDPAWPASLSARVANTLLRQVMGFRGVSITDDLDMGAIAKHYDVPTVVKQICEAGIDIALICRSRQKIEAAHGQFMEVSNASDDTRAAHLSSVRRILTVKSKYIQSESLELV